MPSTRGTKATFSNTVLRGSSLKSWKTKPSERRYACTWRGVSVGQVAAADVQLPFGRHVLAQQQAEQRGLSGAARAGEEDELALVDAEREIAQRIHAAAVHLGEVIAPRSRRYPCPARAAHAASFTSAGFAFPPMALITWPTRNPNVCRLAGAVLRDGVQVGLRAPSATAASTAALVVNLRQPLGRDDVAGAAARGVHLLEHVLGSRAADGARVDEPDQVRQRRGRERHRVDARRRARSSCASARP